jgi:hypothetical protein
VADCKKVKRSVNNPLICALAFALLGHFVRIVFFPRGEMEEAARTMVFWIGGGIVVVALAFGIRTVYYSRFRDRRRQPRTVTVDPVGVRVQKARDARELEPLLDELLRNARPLLPVLWDADVMERVIALAADNSALIAAIQFDSEKTVAALLAAGADANRKHWTHSAKILYVRPRNEMPFGEAVRLGRRSMVKLLLEHGADLSGFHRSTEPSVEDIVAMLFNVGDDTRAREFAKAATGVDIPPRDAEVVARAKSIGSLFVAFAERLKRQSNLPAGKRLCELTVSRWRSGSFAVGKATSWTELSVCLRMLGEFQEAEGHDADALQSYKRALWTWLHLEFHDDPEGYAGQILDESDRDPESLLVEPSFAEIPSEWILTTGEFLLETIRPRFQSGWRFDPRMLDRDVRDEYIALLRDCARILGRLGKTGEQVRVAAALQRVEGVAKSPQ